MPANQIDLTGGFAGQVSITPEEHPDQRAARLKAEARQSLIEDCKGVVVIAERLGPKSELTPHQQKEAIKRRDRGDETLRETAGSYNVSHSTISRLTA
jgi:hypothetical protein